MKGAERYRTLVAERLAGMLAALWLCGCIASDPAVATDVDSREWRDTAVLVFTNRDTLAMRDLRIFLRLNNRFSADTFSVRIGVRSPDSLEATERVTLRIPRVESPAALSREAVIPYRRRVRLALTGDYRVRIVSETAVQGVEAVGIDFGKSE